MAELLPNVPEAYCGLWERTLLERHSAGTLTSDRPARVFWMQSPLWHADLRIPLDRPDFGGVDRLESCSDAVLRFIAGQEAFFGITRVEGVVCTWLRLFDLRPGVALDIGRMDFQNANLLVERGIAEDYLEHWSRRDNSAPQDGQPALRRDGAGRLLLVSSDWLMRIAPRAAAAPRADPYASVDELGRDELMWRASLEITLCEKRSGRWLALLSTHPWIEGQAIEPVGEQTETMDSVSLMDKAFVA